MEPTEPTEPIDYERLLRNLLARIHRDGGHYTEAHGIAKSVADADQRVAELHAAMDVARR